MYWISDGRSDFVKGQGHLLEGSGLKGSNGW